MEDWLCVTKDYIKEINFIFQKYKKSEKYFF